MDALALHADPTLGTCRVLSGFDKALSAHTSQDDKTFWIVTEFNANLTTVMLPVEFAAWIGAVNKDESYGVDLISPETGRITSETREEIVIGSNAANDSLTEAGANMVTCYHRTSEARAILFAGFIDERGFTTSEPCLAGVIVSRRPPGRGWQATGRVVLSIDIPESVLAKYKFGYAGNPPQVACVPAEILNRLDEPKIHEVELAGLTIRQVADELLGEKACDDSSLEVTYVDPSNREAIEHFLFLSEHNLMIDAGDATVNLSRG
jgi:hypothetical protein